MNSYIKYIIEAFDFGSVNKQKKQINVYNTLPDILEKIDNRLNLSEVDYSILTQYIAVYNANSLNDLKDLIEYFTDMFGNECDLNWIDTSNIGTMYELFKSSEFNGNISEWDVSNVGDMYKMFFNSKFNGDISKWNVSNVNKMSYMFSCSEFNGDISSWDVNNVTHMSGMFSG